MADEVQDSHATATAAVQMKTDSRAAIDILKEVAKQVETAALRVKPFEKTPLGQCVLITLQEALEHFKIPTARYERGEYEAY